MRGLLNHTENRCSWLSYKGFLLLLCCFLFSACNSQRILTVYTHPAGAVVTEQGTGAAFGRSPNASANYNRDPNNKNDCTYVRGVTATWPSGAQVSSPSKLSLCGNGQNFTYTLNRPADAPGLGIDIQNEFNQQQIRLQQQQLSTQQEILQQQKKLQRQQKKQLDEIQSNQRRQELDKLYDW